MEIILVATDFSDTSDNAIDYAVELAKLFRSKIILVHAFNLPYSTYQTGNAGDLMHVMQDASDTRLQQVKEKMEQGNSYDFKVECFSNVGFAEDVINETAEKVNADLIVIGIAGDGGKLKENLIGSTAVNVARNANMPVFIIPAHAKYHRVRKISFACDLNKTEESDLVELSRYFGKAFDAELEIVHVEEPGKEFSAEKTETYAIMDKKLETLRHKSVFITEKKQGKALEDYFNEHPTDIIMVSPKKHNLFHNLFSPSVSKELAFHSRVPLLCIH